MMRSLYSGVSGLKVLQTKMDVIGNNIANVNTSGFKKSRVTFVDKLYQSMEGASSPGDGKGGTNAMSIGMGMTLGSVDQIHTPGAAAATGKTTDMAIDGNGYFILKNNGMVSYTRAGAFDFDNQGNLHTADGSIVQGWMADKANGYAIDTSGGNVQSINVSNYRMDPPKATTEMNFTGNLDANLDVSTIDSTTLKQTGKSIITSKEIYDSLGNSTPVYFKFFKVVDSGEEVWNCDISMDPEFEFDATASELGESALGDSPNFDDGTNKYTVIRLSGLDFDTNGELSSLQKSLTLSIPRDDVGAAIINPTIDFGKISQFKSQSTAWVESQNGCEVGILQSYAVGSDGTISGVYNNGELRSLARVALATFQNPGGLNEMGGTMFTVSNNSGDAMIGAPGDSGMGVILPSSLEMSNVDISEEFTDMIVTQRGFQANSRIITSSDEMLQELVNLKR